MGADEQPDPLVGQVLDGRYRIDARLGQGGMGAVYRAHQVAMDRMVAVKVLKPHLVPDPVAARRFAREARGTFRVGSEHAVRVLDFGIDDARTLYMVMEHLDGRTVGAELAVDGPYQVGRAIHIARQVCAALAASHSLGLVHRDIKPENVMLVRRGGDDDFVKVLDFGLAKLMEGVNPAGLSHAALTQGNMVFGTPEYMSPEQATGRSLDGRSDLYSLGATLFEMLVGKPPFVDKSAMAILAHHVQTPAPSLLARRPELADHPAGAGMATLIADCLAKDPARRPASADALAVRLASLAEISVPGDKARRAVATAPTGTMDVPSVPASEGGGGRVTDGDEAVHQRWSSRGRARTRRLAVVGAMGATAMVIAAAVATRGGATTRAGAAASASDAALLVVASPDAGAAPTPGASAGETARITPSPSVTEMSRRVGEVRSRRAPPSAEVEAHLREAARAHAAGKRLLQMAEADSALALDPSNLTARFLFGDALLANGDEVVGCRYLRSARSLSEAKALLASGACRSD